MASSSASMAFLSGILMGSCILQRSAILLVGRRRRLFLLEGGGTCAEEENFGELVEDHGWLGGCLGRGSSSREWEVLLRSLVGASMGEFVWVLWLRKGGGNPWQGPLGREMDMSRAPSKSPTFTKSFHQTSSPRGHKLVHGNRLTHPPPLEECHKLKKSAPAKTAAPAPARKRTRRTTALEAKARAEAERQAIEGRPRAPTKIW